MKNYQFTHQQTGYGTWEIILTIGGQQHTAITHDSRFIDRINDMRADNESWDNIQSEYELQFDSIFENIIESINQ